MTIQYQLKYELLRVRVLKILYLGTYKTIDSLVKRQNCVFDPCMIYIKTKYMISKIATVIKIFFIDDLNKFKTKHVLFNIGNSNAS